MSAATKPATGAAGVRAGGPTTGTAPLLHASVRHDGRKFAPWIVLTTALSTSSVLVYPLVFFFLMLDVLTHRAFIKTNGCDIKATCPKVLACKISSST